MFTLLENENIIRQIRLRVNPCFKLFSISFSFSRKSMPVNHKFAVRVFYILPSYGILFVKKEVFSLNNNRINFDLERKLRRYAISDLMKYVVFGQGILYMLMMVMPTLVMNSPCVIPEVFRKPSILESPINTASEK